MFKDTAMTISEEGKQYLGGVFVEQFVQRKVEGWAKEVERLSTFAVTQPHAAYAAFTHGLVSRWNYLLRVIDWEILSSTDLLQPLVSASHHELVHPSYYRFGSSRETNPRIAIITGETGWPWSLQSIIMAKEQHNASKLMCAPLVDQVIKQDHHLGECHAVQQRIKDTIRSCKHNNQKEEAKNLQIQLPSPLQRSMKLSQERGASAWLTSLPIDDHGFALHKSAFMDALSLRYGWSLQNSKSHCSCGHLFSVEHALTCKTGGFPIIQHNEVRDITASWLSEICHGVAIGPHLQPLTEEVLSHNSAIIDDRARLNVAMYGFLGGGGGRFKKAFIDVRMFNPCAKSNCQSPLTSAYR